MGNYIALGDHKFVPAIDPIVFEKIIKASKSYETHKKEMDDMWDNIFYEVYTEKDPYGRLGFKDSNGGLSSYYG